MPDASPSEAEAKIERTVGNLLRGGVILAATVVALGGTVYLLRHGAEPANVGRSAGEADDLRGLAGTVSSALAWRGRGLIQLGLLLLIATPVARVVLSVVVFARARDYTYVAITLVVLAVLVFSLS